MIQALEVSVTDSWYYSCAIALANTSGDPSNISFISDQMAKIATQSIIGAGILDSNSILSQAYDHLSPLGVPQSGNSTALGLKIAAFAIGSIAGASIYNPHITYEGMVPLEGLHLQLVGLNFYIIIGLICGGHVVICIIVAYITKGIPAGPRTHLEMALTLKPVTDVHLGHSMQKTERPSRWQRHLP
jgi:hypothetical protein